MSTGYRLLDQPNPNYKQYLANRRTWLPSGLPAHGGKVTGGIILHDAEGGTDLVGVDMGAENVAQFICTRTSPGSYHILTDRDSIIRMAPLDYEVWQDVASNPYTVGISVAWNKADLPRMTYSQRLSFYVPFAKAVLDTIAWFKRVKGITVPIGGFISRADILAGRPGLSTHSRMDPSRRSDPFGTGSIYEAEFLAVLAQQTPTATTTTVQEDDDMSAAEVQKILAQQDIILKALGRIDPRTATIANNTALTNKALGDVAGRVRSLGDTEIVNAAELAPLVASQVATLVTGALADVLANRDGGLTPGEWESITERAVRSVFADAAKEA